MVSIQMLDKIQNYERCFFEELPDDIEFHCRRVGIYSRIVASNMLQLLSKAYPGMRTGQILEAVQLGGCYHDIGKVVCRADILDKNKGLSKAEQEALKNHSLRSAEIIAGNEKFKNIKGVSGDAYKRTIFNCCLYHHEQYNGKGYPKKLAGRAIPLEAQIVSACNMFDILISDCGYKEQQKINRAMDIIIAESGKSFAPKVVKTFRESHKELGTALYFMKSL